jgi:hypothetical protein
VNIYIAGIGAVTPAGWGIAAMEAALEQHRRIVPREHSFPGSPRKLLLRTVPDPDPRPGFFSHPRLRRASPLSLYATGAALEALGEKTALLSDRRLMVVCCLQSGPVQYACRFYEEVLEDPSKASPLLFPETVFSAPASHLAALLGLTPCATTFLGDSGAFLQGLACGACSILEGAADLCLVIGAEEFNWFHADATSHLDRQSILGAGAGAVLLTADQSLSIGAQLDLITDPHTYSVKVSPAMAAASMRMQLPDGAPNDLLVDGLGGARRLEKAEQEAWSHWPGKRLSPKRTLGEGLMAGAAWQFVLAAGAVAKRACPAAVASIVGCNQQAIAARIVADAH